MKMGQIGRVYLSRLSSVRASWPLLLAAGLALGSAIGFLELADDIREGDTDAFDNAVLAWLAAYRSPLWTEFFVAITALGSWPVLGLLTLGVCTALWLAGLRGLSLTLAVASLGAPVLASVFKSMYGRARPTIVPHLETVATASFPSGHTIGSVVFFTTLALLLLEYAHRSTLRAFLVGYSLLIGGLVAISRMYLGVHYPSDVAGGGLVAISWVLLVLLVHRRLVHGARTRKAADPAGPHLST